MRDDNGELKVPEFVSEIPKHLLASLSPKEKWQYDQISIQGKQNVWLIERSIKADKRQNETDETVCNLDQRLKVFEDLWKMITAKWSVLGVVMTVFAIPILLLTIGAWITHWFDKH